MQRLSRCCRQQRRHLPAGDREGGSGRRSSTEYHSIYALRFQKAASDNVIINGALLATHGSCFVSAIDVYYI